MHTVALFHRTRQCFSPPGPVFLKVYLHGYQQTQIVLLSGAVHPDKEPEAWALLRNIWACMHICLKTIVHQPAWTERQLWQWQICINDKSQLVTGTDLPKKFYVITPQQNGSSVIVKLLSSLLSYESLNQMGRRREGGRKKEREGETEATRVRWYLCWTDEHRGRKKITVERKAKTYQCSQKRTEGVRERLNIKVSQ